MGFQDPIRLLNKEWHDYLHVFKALKLIEYLLHKLKKYLAIL